MDAGSASASTDLAGALALVPTQPEEALRSLLAAWRARKAPALAELIERLGARIRRPALSQKPAAQALAEWRECERARDPADLHRLVAALRVGTVNQMIERLELLAGWPEDPRIARAALAILFDQPFSSQSARKLYSSAVATLEAMHDPRTYARLEDLKAHRMPGLGAEGGTDFRDFFAAKIERALKAAAGATLPAVLTAAEESAVAKALASLGSSAEEDAKAEAALLAAVWAAPGDDAPRQVYADWLQERGRPHGEFIALQLAAQAGTLGADGVRRAKELQSKYAREFLGPLAPAIQLSNVRFERGFVVHAELSDKRSPIIKELATHPAWATLRSAWIWTSAKRLYPECVAHLQALGVRSLQRDEVERFYS
ncbi:MAG: TIGR02996 domain-containing protein [Myxococcales bacterium]